MAQLYPFRALRYNPALVRVADVVTQPYDKITPDMQARYYEASEYNLVRVILGKAEPADDETNNVYTRAAAYVRDWRNKNVLAMDEQPAIFAYSQRFAVPGRPGIEAERRGFIALGKIYDYADGVVFRHEQTLSKPKSDRLNLLRATRAHFGQIFMLYSDPAHAVESMLFAGDTAPAVEVTDEYGVSHRLSKIDDPNTVNIVCTSMEDKRLIIADGHHRYETALNYRNERTPHDQAREAHRHGQPQPPFPEAAVMMTFVNMDSPGLLILPTHRVVFGIDSLKSDEFARKCQPYFFVERASNTDVSALQRALDRAGEETMIAAVFPDAALLLRAKRDAVDEALPGVSSRQRTLDVVCLHQLILERILEISPDAIREQRNVRYVRSADEAVHEVLQASSRAAAAFLVNPVRFDQMRDIAFAGDVMPQKSTDFYPKLLSGLTAYALE